MCVTSGSLKNLLIIQETWVRSLGQEVALEKGMATHSSLLAWRIPWTEKPGELGSPHAEVTESDTMRQLNTHTQCISTQWLSSWASYT